MSSILFEVKNSVGVITLNRPDKLNSFNREMALLMQEKLDECKSKEVRCVYITGAGKGFSAGQDLSEVVDPNGPGMGKILSEHYNPIIIRIRKWRTIHIIPAIPCGRTRSSVKGFSVYDKPAILFNKYIPYKIIVECHFQI